jgi:Cft2 family RNA processing exonuclease
LADYITGAPEDSERCESYFAAAVRGVTGFQHLLEFNGNRLLRDCGMHQGRRKESSQQDTPSWIDFFCLPS